MSTLSKPTAQETKLPKPEVSVIARFELPLIWLLVICSVLLVTACSGPDSTPPESIGLELTAKDIEVNNRGVALMGYFDYAGAREAFREAVDRQPDWHDVKVNLAIATLNRQFDGDEQMARTFLEEVLLAAPDNLRAHFVAGLLAERAGESDKAKNHYSTVLDNDPLDAYAAYYLAVLTQSEDPAKALELFELAITLDPYLRSAYYGAFLLNVRTGNREEGLEMQAVYERLADNPRARLAETKYTRMGQKANALAVNLTQESTTELPNGPVFLEPQTLHSFAVPQNRSITTVDLGIDGLQDLFIANPQGPAQIILAGEDEYKLSESHVLGNLRAVTGAAWADIDNDGKVDLAVCADGNMSVRFQSGVDVWSKPLSLTSLAAAKSCSDVQLLDADHDGDLDIYAAFTTGGHDVFSNNGNRTFRSLQQERNLEFSDSPGKGLVAADIDSDRDTDLITINEAGVGILFNDRLWDYTMASEQPESLVPASLLSAKLLALTAIDANADGRVELYGVNADGQLVRWSRDGATQWSSSVLASLNVNGKARIDLDVSDFDGDGVLDLLVVDADGFAVWSLKANGIAKLFGFEGDVVGAMHIVADADRGPSVLALTNTPEGQKLLRFPPGPGRGSFSSFTFEGKEEQADSMRSNRSGIGTRVAIRRGSDWTVTDTFDRHSGPGQSSQPLAVGFGTSENVDFVAIDWSDGVFQTELDLESGQQHSLTETQRQLSSCPVLFAWDGKQWAFVSDLLGVGGIGFLHDPGADIGSRYGAPRPWEYFQLPAAALASDGSLLKLKITEPMEELALLDNVQLVAWDLAPGWNLVLDERMGTGGPLVTGKAKFYQTEIRPVRVTRDDGLDLTSSVARQDFVAADLGRAHPRFLGMLETPRALTMHFDQPLDTLGSDLLLKAHGWVEYPYSQTVFAAWQAGASYTPPTLLAGDGDGNWTVVLPEFGYPAGMPRTMSVPLGELPQGTVELRLSSNLEIYWDELSIVQAAQPDASQVQRQLLHLQAAELGQIGFPKRIQQPQKRPDYDFNDRVPFWDTRYPKGNYSQLGDVLPLLTHTDGAFATFGPGEEVEVAFNEPMPLPENWSRTYVLFVSGYAKDMDMFTQNSGTVGPLPELPSSNQSLHKQYNTRYRDSY